MGEKGELLKYSQVLVQNTQSRKGFAGPKWTPADGHTQKAQAGGPQQGPCTGGAARPRGWQVGIPADICNNHSWIEPPLLTTISGPPLNSLTLKGLGQEPLGFFLWPFSAMLVALETTAAGSWPPKAGTVMRNLRQVCSAPPVLRTMVGMLAKQL